MIEISSPALRKNNDNTRAAVRQTCPHPRDLQPCYPEHHGRIPIRSSTLEMRKAWYDAKVKDGYPFSSRKKKVRVVDSLPMAPFRAWPPTNILLKSSSM